MMGNNDKEASTKKEFANGKEKIEAEATVAKDKGMIQTPGKKEKKADVANGASLCSRLVFFVLLASLALTISLFRLDYKKGQLQELKAQLPPEIHDVLEKAENVSRDLIVKVTELYIKSLETVEELSSHVPVRDKTLADILFSDKKPKTATAELEAEETAEKDAELAIEKLKEEELEEKKRIEKEKKRFAAEEESSKKLFAEAEQKRQMQFLQSRLAAEAENKRLAAEEEKRQLEESEARKKSELEAFKKAEAEAAILEMEFAEERRKKEEAEAIKKTEEELAEKLRAEKLNAEIEEKHRLAQEEANIKFLEVKKRLKETGAEFVSNEEFDKIKDKEIGKGASAAA